MNEEIIRMEHITKRFPLGGGRMLTAVDDITFSVRRGETFGIVGESGSGKSTLARILTRLEEPTAGRILFRGQDVTGLSGEALRQHRRSVQMVFQDPSTALDPKLRIQDILCEPLLNFGLIRSRDVPAKARELLRLVNLPEDFAGRYPHHMSGGQRQRVAIGRAIVRSPKVLLMDEPLSNLDAKLRNQMRAEIIKLRQRINTTFIYVTHDQTEAMTLGDRIVIMKDGFIQQIGTPQEVFDHPANLFVAGFIGTPQMNLFDAKLVKNSDGKYAVAIDGINVELAEDKQARLSAKNVPEQDVTLGVRPDHIMLCADGVKGTVDVSELMGSSVHLHISTHGHDVVVIVPTNGNASHFPMGSEVNMIFGGNVAHVFSKETEKNLEW